MAILVSWKGNFRTFQLMKVREKSDKKLQIWPFSETNLEPFDDPCFDWNFGLVLVGGVELQK